MSPPGHRAKGGADECKQHLQHGPEADQQRSGHAHEFEEYAERQHQAEAPALVKTVENGKVVYSRPHQAKVVTDSQGTELFLEYKGRKVADI